MSILRDRAPVLMLLYLPPAAHYHSVSLALSPEARALAPAAWQPLVSLTQLLCCLSHSQHSLPPQPQQHQDECSSINKQSASSASSLFTVPSRGLFGGFLQKTKRLQQKSNRDLLI